MDARRLDAARTGRVGDELVVDGPHLGDPVRRGQIMEVLGGDVPHFRVQWDDGHESLYFPGSDSHVIHLREQPKR